MQHQSIFRIQIVTQAIGQAAPVVQEPYRRTGMRDHPTAGNFYPQITGPSAKLMHLKSPPELCADDD
ncbi:hypothetical protein GCM10027456_81890 [Kineosporia babensis]